MNKNDLRSFVEFGYFFTSNDKVLFDHVVEKIELPAEREELKQLAYNNWMYSVEQDFLTSLRAANFLRQSQGDEQHPHEPHAMGAIWLSEAARV